MLHISQFLWILRTCIFTHFYCGPWVFSSIQSLNTCCLMVDNIPGKVALIWSYLFWKREKFCNHVPSVSNTLSSSKIGVPALWRDLGMATLAFILGIAHIHLLLPSSLLHLSRALMGLFSVMTCRKKLWKVG